MIGGVAVLFVFAAVFAFLISMMLANNRAQANAAAAPKPADWRPPDSGGASPGA